MPIFTGEAPLAYTLSTLRLAEINRGVAHLVGFGYLPGYGGTG